MDQKCMVAFVIGVIGLILIMITKSFDSNSLKFLSELGGMMIIVYMLALGYFMYQASNSILKAIIHQSIPIVLGIIVFLVLTDLILVMVL